MKKTIIFCLLTILCKVGFAQTIQISGTVTDDKGNPVAFAFIKDAQHNYQTFSGQDGSFYINADPSSRLMATCAGYQKTTVPVNNSSTIKIQMQHNESSSATVAKSDAFNVEEIGGTDRSARPLTNFGTAQEQLHGSPYLLDHWVHGYAISPKDSIIQNNYYLFNYMKIEGSLLYTDDGKTVYGVYKDRAPRFVLFDNDGTQYIFENVSSVDSKHYLQVLSEGSKYKIYKQLNTEFVKANFETNGIVTTGVNYDSYSDQPVYYFVKTGGQPQKLALKRKAIKAAFSDDPKKIDSFLSAHDSDDLNDDFFKALGDYMNQ
jgi:hypothetical protein